VLASNELARRIGQDALIVNVKNGPVCEVTNALDKFDEHLKPQRVTQISTGIVDAFLAEPKERAGLRAGFDNEQ
jgi:hypothetical protein